MNFVEYKSKVSAIFPNTFDNSLVVDVVDDVLASAVDKALSKFEKIASTEVTGSTMLPDALSISKFTLSTNSVGYSVFDMYFGNMSFGRDDFSRFMPRKGEYYFTPDRKLLVRGNARAYVEYVVDPSTLDVTDLSGIYIDWVVRYGNALLKIKEGYLGTRAQLTELPFDFNYKDLKDSGEKERDNLEEELEEMYYGLFTSKG